MDLDLFWGSPAGSTAAMAAMAAMAHAFTTAVPARISWNGLGVAGEWWAVPLEPLEGEAGKPQISMTFEVTVVTETNPWWHPHIFFNLL